jgi:hypothetical protein
MAILGEGNAIKSVQRGETVGSASVTISAVNTAKSVVTSSFTSLGSTGANSYNQILYSNHGGDIMYGYGYGYGYGKAGGRAYLSNSTTLTVTATDGNTTTAWEVIEYA